MLTIWNKINKDTLEKGRIGILFFILFLPCLSSLFMSVDIQKEFSDRIGYLLLYILVLLLPLSFLKSKFYFLFEGVFLLFAPIEIIHLKLLGMPVSSPFITSMLQTDFKESMEVLSSFKLEIIIMLLVWGIYFIQVYKVPNRYLGTKWFRIALIPLFIIWNVTLFANTFLSSPSGSTFSGRLAVSSYRVVHQYYKIFPVNLFLSYTKHLKDNSEVKAMNERLKSFKFGVQSLTPPNEKELYVLVIGESARADHFSINGYERKTTPLLEQTENLVSFRDVLSTANITVRALPLLLSRATPESPEIAYQEKTLPEAFKECGFSTAWIANQSFNDPYVLRIAHNSDYHHFELVDYSADNNYDEKLLPKLDKVLAFNKQKQFIVIHTLGNHFKYNYRHPENFEKFKPAMPKDFSYNEIGKDKKAIVTNSYDNSVLYTDFILSEIIKRVQQQSCIAAVSYISDHAENLYDDGTEELMHSSSNPSRNEVHVPFIVWLSDSYRKQFPKIYDILNSHKDSPISSNNLFHTMLKISNITYPDEKPNLSITSEEFQGDSIREVLTPNGKIVYLH